MTNLENAGFWYFLLTRRFFWYFYPRYLTNGNSKAYWPYHFLKKLNKIFQVKLNALPKLGLISFYHQQKRQQWAIFNSLITMTPRVNMITRQMTPFSPSTLWALSIGIFSFAFQDLHILIQTQFQATFRILLWFVKFTFTWQRWRFQVS